MFINIESGEYPQRGESFFRGKAKTTFGIRLELYRWSKSGFAYYEDIGRFSLPTTIDRYCPGNLTQTNVSDVEFFMTEDALVRRF